MFDTEITIVGILVVAALVCGIWSSQIATGRRKGLLGFLAAALFGGAFAFTGIWNLIGIKTAKHLSLSGTITSLEQHPGRNPWSEFTVVPLQGQPVRIHSDYAGPKLANGENVVVEALSFHSTLLHLEVLAGRNIGWKYDEGDGTISSAIVVVLGIVLILTARTRWLRNPEGA